MKIWQILMVSVAAGVTLPALAQMAEGSVTRAEVEAQVRDRLNRFDADKDGIVTRDEIMTFSRARRESRADDVFKTMDTDKNGSISRSEYDAFQAKGGDRRLIGLDRPGDPDGMMPPPPPRPHGFVPPPAPPGADGKRSVRDRTRLMMGDRVGTIMADVNGKGIVIADAVKRALDRFDTTDTDKDGKISPEERKAQRATRRAKMS